MPASTVLEVTQQRLRGLVQEALTEAAALALVGVEIEERRERAVMSGLRLGRALGAAKELVRHGEWETFRDAQLPGISERQDQRCRALAGENPKAQSFADLDGNSVRKFFMGYVPAKDRAELEGDATLKPGTHHLTVVNDWRKFCRRRELGLIQVNDEEVRKDFRPLYDWLCGLYQD